MNYVILAAGHGSRLAKEGATASKPMIPLLGRPMVGRLIDLLKTCGAEHINVVANPRMNDFMEYLIDRKEADPCIDVRPIVTENSYESLCEGARGLQGRFIAMTVDAIFPTEEFRRYVAESETLGPDAVLMGLTRFVDDESPLYAKIDPATGEVVDYRYGGQPFEGEPIVSAGMYALSDAAMAAVKASGIYPSSLSNYQHTLATATPIRVLPYEYTKALDVDNHHDLEVAEQFLRSVNGADAI